MSRGKIAFELHERFKDDSDIIDDVDFGNLMMNLGSHEHSRLFSVTFERTQEIELLMVVAGILGTAYFKRLGEGLADWTIDELKRRVELRRAEIKVGRKKITVGRRGRKAAIKELEKLLRQAHQKGQGVEITMVRKTQRR